jgi:nucleoside 2-deoxyribosyltransferase
MTTTAPEKATMKVYIAAPFQCLGDADLLRQQFETAGIGCTARWITDALAAELSDEWARNDLADVAAADALVAMNPAGWESSGTGGRHVEFGYALALDKPIYLLGERTNIFHHLSRVVVKVTAADVIASLRTLNIEPARQQDVEVAR